jgi:hypothetical protein
MACFFLGEVAGESGGFTCAHRSVETHIMTSFASMHEITRMDFIGALGFSPEQAPSAGHVTRAAGNNLTNLNNCCSKMRKNERSVAFCLSTIFSDYI